MKFLVLPITKHNAVGINSTPEDTTLMFKCPNLENETNPKVVHVKTTPEEIITFLKLTPRAHEALRILLNQEIVDE